MAFAFFSVRDIGRGDEAPDSQLVWERQSKVDVEKGDD